jgi:hypothetical protein
MTTRQHYSEFTVGERVRVESNEKRPPDAHCRKLRRWKERNYMGEVKEIQEPYPPLGNGYKVSNPNGGLSISDDRWAILQHSLSLGTGHGLRVERIVTLEDGTWHYADAA